MSTIENIKLRAELVKNATTKGENTAARVGGVISDLVDAVGIGTSLAENALSAANAATTTANAATSAANAVRSPESLTVAQDFPSMVRLYLTSVNADGDKSTLAANLGEATTDHAGVMTRGQLGKLDDAYDNANQAINDTAALSARIIGLLSQIFVGLPTFNGFITRNVSIETFPLDAYNPPASGVQWSAQAGCFLYYYADKYYKEWSGSGAYQTSSAADATGVVVTTPLPGKVFENTANGRRYVFHEPELTMITSDNFETLL